LPILFAAKTAGKEATVHRLSSQAMTADADSESRLNPCLVKMCAASNDAAIV
jgi:hypothetical protein